MSYTAPNFVNDAAPALSASNMNALAQAAQAAAVTADIGVVGTATDNALKTYYVGQGLAAKQTVGDGGDPNSSVTQNVKLLVTANRTNPTQAIEQHFVGYSFYSGTPGPSCGSLQGGSCEASVFNNGTGNIAPAILGFEGIGAANGDNGYQVSQVIGVSGTSFINGTQGADMLVSLRASGPRRDSGTGTVTEARSLDVQEPQVGTARRAIYSIGAARFVKGTATNVVEVASAAGTLTWSLNPQVITGYASDGVSTRLTLDSQDTPTAGRINSQLFGSGKHVSFVNSGTEVLSAAADGTFSLLGTGQLVFGNSANHALGSGTPALGANFPGTVTTAPYVWQKVKAADGTQCYIPMWK